MCRYRVRGLHEIQVAFCVATFLISFCLVITQKKPGSIGLVSSEQGTVIHVILQNEIGQISFLINENNLIYHNKIILVTPYIQSFL